MASGVTPDGIPVSNRVENFSDRKLHAKVVDNILNSRTLWSRLNGNGTPFIGSTMDYTIKITDSGLGEFYSGLETLSTAASDNTITLSYAHTAFAQPVVLPLLESMANTGPKQAINLDQHKFDEAVAEATQKLGSAVYGTGSGDQPLGLGAIVDDGTDVSTIGGQSRSTYSTLKATRTDSGGTLSLSKLATLYSAVSSAGINSEKPTSMWTTQTIFDLYESLLAPQVRAEYASVGFNAVSLRGTAVLKSEALLKGAAGFTALTYRGVPLIADDAAPAENLWMLNERYVMWKGRTTVPSKFAGFLSRVSLGTPSTMEGVASAPSKYHGWFSQKPQMMPNQAGIIARYHVIGQLVCSQPRRNGRLTGITSV